MAAGKADRSDPYAVLGVDRTASPAEIRAAYRALVARYHPDRHQGNPLEGLASERMVEINQAYDLLSDPARRAAFDPRWSRGAGSTGAAPARAGAGRWEAPPPPARPGMSPIIKWGLVILLLPVLVRSGAGLLRGIAGLLRALLGAVGGFRGTPVGLALAVVALALLGWALWRRHRRSR